MKVLVINSGSSSIKYKLFEMPGENCICSGIAERIGHDHATITRKTYVGINDHTIKKEHSLPNHEVALRMICHFLTDESGVIKNTNEIQLVGHRVVHGGEKFHGTTVIDDEVKEEICQLFALAPLHNPGHLIGIEVAEKLFKNAIQMAVFDTAFHQTIPEKAFRYAIPEKYYTELGIRVYGFHGTSHKYVSEEAATYLQNPKVKLITIHLGNGCSMAAISRGQCIDTSMGLGPLDGLIMGTRSGSIDPSVIFYLASQTGMSLDDISGMLNKESGMLGLTGCRDMRDVYALYETGDPAAALAYQMYAYRIKKFIGSYAAALGGLDGIIFTGGVGENDAYLRELVCDQMEYFGLELDPSRNQLKGNGIRMIGTENSATKILIIPTNEELEIARQCYATNDR